MSDKWKARMAVGLFALPFTYFFAPNLWWFLPRLLFGHNRALYGTYEGYVVAEDGTGVGSAGDRVRVRMRVRPSASIDTGNTYGYTWSDFTEKPDALGGSVEVQEGNVTVAHFSVHGHEEEPGETGPTFYIYAGEDSAQMVVTAQGKALLVGGVMAVPHTNNRSYGGLLVKRGN